MYKIEDIINKVHCADCLFILKQIPDEVVNCVITSPPYWGLRDYGVIGQLGLEKTPEEYVAKMVEIFRDVKRVLKKEGTLWLNIGDSYVSSNKDIGTGGINDMGYNSLSSVINQRRAGRVKGLKPKNLVGIPWRVAFVLQSDGWYLRQDIIWAKPNPMPESVTDRCTKSHEYVFLLAKSQKYYFDNEAIKEDSIDLESYTGRRFRGAKAIITANARPYSNPNTLDKGNEADGKTYEKRNKRSVWTITTQPFKGAHFVTFPEKLVEPMILAGCPKGGIILDPFAGSGTTCLVAKKLGRKYIGIDLNPDCVKMSENRLSQFEMLPL